MGQKFFARVDLNCKTALERQFSPKKIKIFGATRQFHNTVQKYYIITFFTCHRNTCIYFNLFSHKNMYCLGPGYSRKGTLDSDLKNLGGVKNFLDHLGGWVKNFLHPHGGGSKKFSHVVLKNLRPPHPVLNEHSLRSNN